MVGNATERQATLKRYANSDGLSPSILFPPLDGVLFASQPIHDCATADHDSFHG
jgi:hypothetical protein